MDVTWYTHAALTNMVTPDSQVHFVFGLIHNQKMERYAIKRDTLVKLWIKFKNLSKVVFVAINQGLEIPIEDADEYGWIEHLAVLRNSERIVLNKKYNFINAWTPEAVKELEIPGIKNINLADMYMSLMKSPMLFIHVKDLPEV